MKNYPQFVVIHIVKGFGVINKAELDVFLEFFSFSYDPTDVGNLISGSSDFSKSSLNILKFMVQVLNECAPCCVGPPKMDGSWWRVLTGGEF